MRSSPELALPRVTALLGPTNTGKTHQAVERMLAHPTGMMGLPLRLLAREIYDRVSARLGESAVALITGEEKRIPARPRYWICTVEAMPVDRAVDFLAVDEVQLGAHRERGHVFTDRVLGARGREETWLLGADTARPLLRELVPGVELTSRPRLSVLRSAGRLSLRDLPPRSAVVAFSAQRVYALAERMRARRGGAAVVLGALSPRARNAQVALYQSGEVDTLVATDAIGMGLNLDVDLVAFADLAKFDGRHVRDLEAAELAQIAGRAGRFRSDGQFAVLEPLSPLPSATLRALETHRFAPLAQLYWRSSALDFSSVDHLLASLRQPPPHPALRLAAGAADEQALLSLQRHPTLASHLASPEALTLAWEVCQIPDFRQLALDDHADLQALVFEQLVTRGRLREDWVRERIEALDQGAGDLETLLARLAFIRTWTYVSHKPSWVVEAAHWQERARAIEDKLSDALHAELVRRFVDQTGRRGRNRRARLREELGADAGGRDRNADLGAREGGGAGSTRGRPSASIPATASSPTVGSGSLADQLRALVGPAWARPGTASAAEAAAGCGTGSASLPSQELEAIIAASHTAFQVDDDGRLRFRGGRPLARLVRGPDLARPDVALLVADEVGAGARLRLSRRLLACARDLAPSLLGAMGELPRDANPVVRGLVYQIEQGLGTLSLEDAAAQLRDLSADDEGVLRRLGVERGRFCLYVPRLFAAEPLRLRAVLCRTFLAPGPRPPLPRPDELVLSVASDVPRRAYQALGFVVLDRLAVRADALEAVARRARSGWPPRELIRRLKCLPAQATALRSALLGAATRAADERTAEGAEDGLPSSRSGAHGPLPAG